MKFHVIFSGQSSEYIDELKMLALHPEVAAFLKEVEPLLAEECASAEVRRSGYCPDGLFPWSWASGAITAPPPDYLVRSEVSQPMLFITAMAHAVALRLFPEDRPEIAAYGGHSQGIVAAVVAAQGRSDLEKRTALVARYLLWQGIRMQNSCGWFAPASFEGMTLSPMLALTGSSRREIQEILDEMPESRRPDVSLRNTPDRHVLSGNPQDLALFMQVLNKKYGRESKGRKIWFDAEPLAVSGAYHCRLMAQGRRDIDADLARLGLDFAAWPILRPVYSCHDGSRLDLSPHLTRTLMDIQYTGTVDWPAAVKAMADGHPDVQTAVIPGPGAGLRKLTAGLLHGRLACVPSPDVRSEDSAIVSWSRPTNTPDGRVAFSSRFTERTGKKPLILAGMTPTTATSRLVAAVANAGYVAELAGGGQVTEKIFRRRMEELRELLQPGAAVVLNTLYLDPYLFDLHMRKLLFRLKKEGYPLCGFTLTAGVPPVAEARNLLDKAAEHGMDLCSFKVGTPEQIEQVIAIAKAAPEHFMVIQVEGGEGGGHHGWYGLKNLLARSWLRLRDLPNVALAAGGGVRDAGDVESLLSGTWYDGPAPRPLDAVLVGTLAMACAEAETSPAVKAALVAARGDENGWPGPGSDVVSGKSSLGASIWYLRNTAAEAARLADEATSRPERLPALRETLREKIDRTAKPVFGDLEKMTYAQWLTRFVELTAVGTGGPFENGVWLSEDHEEKFVRMVRRVQMRLNAETNLEIDSQNPIQTVASLVERHPELQNPLLEPDRAFFLQLCDEPGKPMPFVPRIDAEIRRRYLSDSLFYAHDPRFSSDAVLVIPGPRAVGGITRADVPAAQLFGELLGNVVPADAKRNSVQKRVEFTVSGTDWKKRIGAPWSSLFLAARMHTSRGIQANPLAALVFPAPGDCIVFDAEVFTWRQGTQEKLRIGFPNSDGNRVEGMYFMKMAGGDTVPLPLAFELPQGWDLPHFDDAPFFAAIDEAYGTRTFLKPANQGEYAQAMGRPAEYKAYPFLPWHASAALAPMVGGIRESPLGLLHYRSRVRLADVPPVDAADTNAIRTVEQAGMQARCHFLTDDGRVAVEADGEFAPRDPARAGNLQALSPSGFAREECLFDSDVHLGETRLQAPADADAFALCGGDRNPLHADAGIARLAGFSGPIHHGLWTQAAVVAEIEKSMRYHPRAIAEIRTRFLGPVPFGAALKLRVLRRGRSAGRHLLRALVESDGVVLTETDLHVDAHPTAYVCPGQGVQKKGMHEPMYSASEAARDVWDRADAYTRKHLGFSLLHVVRENPVRMEMPGGPVQHPEGVLHLTQFTQVALVVFACAAVARLREAGAFVEDAHFSGHSLGEYSALSAIGGLLTLEDVVRVVYQRGLTMQHFVPRDERGESPFRLGVIRPNHAGITERQMFALVAEIASVPEQYIEIVNYNCRGKQYAVTGYKKGLNELRKRLGDGVTGKAPYVEVPGIDVPFHSTLLRAGVDAFRNTLESVFPEEIDPAVLEDRYWPNLTGKPFRVDGECLQDVLRRTNSERIATLLHEMESGHPAPRRAARTLLVEMLAYQFASPVQWIDIQEGMAKKGIREIVEIGPGHQPTLMNLFAQTLAGMNLLDPPSVLHMEIHFERVLGRNAEDEFCVFPRESAAVKESVPAARESAPDMPAPAVPSAVPEARNPAASPAPAAGVVHPKNPVENGLYSLLALLSGAWPEEIDAGKSIEDLLQGNSARRNQMLSELQKEFGLKKTDGLADLPLGKLAGAVEEQTAGAYRFPGPTLASARRDMFALLPGLSAEEGIRHLTSKYALDAAGAEAVLGALAPYAREGKSKLSGAPNPFPFPASDAASSRAILDAAAARGLGLTGPAAPASGQRSGGAVVDAGALQELEQRLLGPEGVLGKLGAVLDDATGRTHLSPPAEPKARMAAGVPLEDPVFDEERIVAFTAADNWIRVQAMRLAAAIEAGRDPEPEAADLRGRVTEQALQILETARARCARENAPRFDHWISELKKSMENQEENEFSIEMRTLSGSLATAPLLPRGMRGTLVVTGAGPNSIAEGVIIRALKAGWNVVSGVSRLDDARMQAAGALYRRHAAASAKLWLVPMRQGNFDDVDAFSRWVVTAAPGNAPMVLLPFAAVGKNGMAQDTGPEHEAALRVNLLGVERLVGKLAEELAQNRDPRILDVVLPMSPNQGDMGGDGLYGESKIALRALLNKWRSEPLLRARTRMAGAVIGWVRSTGLMHGQDELAADIEKALGVKTFDTSEMGAIIFNLARIRHALENPEPVTADCTGGLARIPDWGEAFRKFRAAAPAARKSSRLGALSREDSGVLPFPARRIPSALPAANPAKLPWEEWVVVVGYGEIGPFGDEEARWQYEIEGKLGPDSILHVALMTGLARYDSATGDIVDAATNRRMSEREAARHFESEVHARVGIRWRPEEGPDAGSMVSLEAITISEPRLIPVDSMETARRIQAQDPAYTECLQDPSGRIFVKKLPGAKIYVACRRPFRNRVAGMLPSGWNPGFFGLSEGETADRDRNTVMMLAATARALARMGVPWKEILRRIHPSRIGNTLGSGIGGMERLIRLYTDPVWNHKRDPISLQESLGNVGAGHVSQELLGNYGPMVSPVGACATAGISVETAWEKLRLRRADLMAAGAFDDISYAGTIGFDDMSATVDAPLMERLGIPPQRMSRPQDRRRKGFVESQGGGTLMLMRAGDAVRLGLPIYGVVGHAWSFGDGFHQSIPAPGFGTLAVARGGKHSELARALSDYGLGIDDVGVVSLHGTSTPVNDPHETGIFQKIFEHLGRTPGNPAIAVSQKAVTGHTKGGASALQAIGVLQMMRDAVVPGHRNLEDLDDRQQQYSHLVFPADPMPLPPERLKAALVSTLGFGHVSSLILMVHPGILLSNLEETTRHEYLRKAFGSGLPGELEFRWGIRPALQIPRSRPFAKEEEERRFLLEEDRGEGK